MDLQMCDLMNNLRNDIGICSHETNTFKTNMMNYMMSQMNDFHNKKENDINIKMNSVLETVITKICDKFKLDNDEVIDYVKDEMFNVTNEEKTEEEENDSENIIKEDVCVVVEEESNICNAWIKTKNCKCEKIRKPNSEYCGYHRNYRK